MVISSIVVKFQIMSRRDYRYCNAEWDGIMEGDGSLVLDDEEEEDLGTKVASSTMRERERFEA